MDTVWLILILVAIVAMAYAITRLRAGNRAGWEDVFTPIHGGEEFAIDFRAALASRGIESRIRYPGVGGAPGIGMSGASEVWVSVRRRNIAAARDVLNEMLDERHKADDEKGPRE